jgi:hypothetical protein
MRIITPLTLLTVLSRAGPAAPIATATPSPGGIDLVKLS